MLRREEEVLKKFRTSRAKTTIAIRFLLTLVIVPLLTQQLSKHFIVKPILDRIGGYEADQVFLNSEMKEEAFEELKIYEENLKFEALIHISPPIGEAKSEKAPEEAARKGEKLEREKLVQEKAPEEAAGEGEKLEREKLVQEKAIEIAQDFRRKSKDAISNVFADLIAVAAFVLTLLVSRKEIVVFKSFMDDLVYGLSDSAKAFILILLTDIFVGFHSPHGWEVLLEGMANHLGIVADHSMISLFIATVPVIMDTILKYWIFRYMSRMSPSTVATYKGMNE
jgi:CemA family